jgi:uncharacterized protein YeaO (DUF488 family)
LLVKFGIILQQTQLFDKFNKVCKKYATEMDSESEFLHLCALLQDNSLIELKKAKEVRNHKVIRIQH